MAGSRQYCFTHPSGEDIYLFTLRNNKDTEVLITNYGGIITSFKIKQPGKPVNDIVLGFDKVEDYTGTAYLQQYPWFGCAIGRYANRIANASFELNGKRYNLSPNVNDDHLHGGLGGFDRKVWKVDTFVQSPRSSLTLDLTSPDGEEGYPGNLTVTLQFELSDDDELSIEYFATSDQPTPVNLTHHSYFNLNNGEGRILDHQVCINASMILEQDEKLITTGRFTAVGSTLYDFREMRTIEKEMKEEGFDQSFLLDKTDGKLSLAAEAVSERSGLKLQVFTTEPIVHFYTGRWIPVIKGKKDINYAPFSGFCLETHKHPNAINIPHFPDTVLRPGEKYYQKTVYKVVAEEK